MNAIRALEEVVHDRRRFRGTAAAAAVVAANFSLPGSAAVQSNEVGASSPAV